MNNLEQSMQKLERFTRFLIYVSVLVMVIGASIITYWFTEPDPLIVSYPEHKAGEIVNKSVCSERRFTIKRYVESTADIDIYVQERWHKLDGSMDVNGVEGELVMPKPIHYPLGAGFAKEMTFSKTVPRALDKGMYEYRPWATYRVNPIKTITKQIPTQIVDVVCDYDPSKHGPME